MPESWDGKILVPFAIEAPLSGVEERLSPEEALWYERTVGIEKRDDKRYHLHFEAVDYASTIWVNDEEVGKNTGGNLPFSFDVTDAIVDGENVIRVRVTDGTDTGYQLHGKQVLSPRGIWYTPVSGIWQTVWMEETPEVAIEHLKITTKASGRIIIEVNAGGAEQGKKVTATVFLGEERIASRFDEV